MPTSLARAPSSSELDVARPPSAAHVYQPPPSTFVPSDDMNKGTVHAVNTLVGSRRSWKTMPEGKEPVWPPQLEAALIEGLEKYRPGSNTETRQLRRFPKRNRYISDYIHQITGKRRTPKQVGSRLQQLRDTCHDPRILDLVCRKEYPPANDMQQMYPPLSSMLPPIPALSIAFPRKNPLGGRLGQAISPPYRTNPEDSGPRHTWPQDSTTANQYNSPYLPLSPDEVVLSPNSGTPRHTIDVDAPSRLEARNDSPEIAAKQEEVDAAPPKIRRNTVVVNMAFRRQPILLTSPTYGVVGLQGTRASDTDLLGAPLAGDSVHHVNVDAPEDLSARAPEVAFHSFVPPHNWYCTFRVVVDGTEVHREEASVHTMSNRPHTYFSHLIPTYWAILCHSYDLSRCVVLQDVVSRDTGSIVCSLRYLFRDNSALPVTHAPSSIEQWRQSTTAGDPYETAFPHSPPMHDLPPAQTTPPPHPSTRTGPPLPPGWPEDKVYHSSFHSVRQPQPQHGYTGDGFLKEWDAAPSPQGAWQEGSVGSYQEGVPGPQPSTAPATTYVPPYATPSGAYQGYAPPEGAPPPSWTYTDVQPSQAPQW
ncbi:hypothetical protein BD626DRAFT_546930 [Schizophyllum amplum]|uniref:TEA domain-containing protein n=1 Tax=Schizophyllum amplum TaxID=97359 RepID=A0A550CL04_9AGAR|nr:hypothetical protein BD626DRAFT_546930 [Auriculariopsis ampla]